MPKKERLDPSALRRTLTVIRPHLPRHLLLCLVGMIGLLADVAFRVLEPWPLKFAVDAVTAALGADLPSDASPFGLNIEQTVIAAAIRLALIIAGRAGFNYLATVSFAKVGARIATELRTRVFDHIQALSLRYHSRASIGDTSQRLVGDVGRLQDVAVTAGLPLVGNVITLTVLLVVMVILDPLLSGIVIATGLAYLLLSRRSSPKIVRASRSTRKGEGSLVGAAAEALGAIRVVQSYNLEKTVAHEFAGGNEKAMKAGVKAKKLAAGLERATDVLVGIAQGTVLVVGSLQVLRGEMSPGDMVLFLTYLKIAMKPLRDMAKYTGRIARASASGERIADLMDEEIEIADPARPVPMRQVRGTVEFSSLTSPDGHGRPLFDSLSLRIPAGQHLGILGPSGGREVHAGLLPAAPERAPRGPDPCGRLRHPLGEPRGPAPPRRDPAAGVGAVHRDGAREHPLRPTGRHARRDRGGRAPRRRPRLHHGSARGVRHRARQPRGHPLRRAAPAHRDRPRHDPPRPRGGARRGHDRPRPGREGTGQRVPVGARPLPHHHLHHP